MIKKLFAILFISLSILSCTGHNVYSNLDKEWEYRVGFDKKWLENPENYKWEKIRIPQNLFRIKGIDKNTKAVTFRKNISEMTDAFYLKANTVAIRSGMVSDAAYFYLDDISIGNVGSIDPYESGFEREFIKVIESDIIKDKSSLYVAVYNFNKYSTFGLLGPYFRIGDPSSIIPGLLSDVSIYIIIVVIYFVFAFFHISIGLRIKNEFYNLYFGVFCLVMACFSMANLPGKELIFGSHVFLRVRLDNISLPFLTASFLMFISLFFFRRHERVPVIISLLCVSMTPIQIFIPIGILKYFFIVWSVITVFMGMTYALFHIIRRILKREIDAALILFGSILFFSAVFHDILATEGFTEYIILSPYSFLLFNVGLVIILVNRFFVVHNKLEVLNLSLEKKVETRTSEIKKLNEELNESNIKLKEKNIQLTQMAEHDSLTGLLNHRSFYERLKEVFCESVRFNFQFSIIMMDIDNFKTINDRYGHQAGDIFLQKISGVIKDSVRVYDIKTRYINAEGLPYSFDITGRYGGDEFSLILPHCNGEHAIDAAQRIMEGVGKIEINNEEAATVSIGIAVYDPMQKCEDERSLLKLADDALYHAKEKGKNRIEILYF